MSPAPFAHAPACHFPSANRAQPDRMNSSTWSKFDLTGCAGAQRLLAHEPGAGQAVAAMRPRNGGNEWRAVGSGTGTPSGRMGTGCPVLSCQKLPRIAFHSALNLFTIGIY